MRAVILTAPNGISVTDIPEPSADGRAIVELEQVGICGTDVKIVHGAIPVAYPRVIAHELVGRVVRAAAGSRVPVRSRVLVDPAFSCGACRACLADGPNLCPSGGLLGRDRDGGAAERIAVHEDRLHVVPEAVTAEAAALLQVLGTCVHAQAGVEIRPPDVAVVVGLGVSGLLHVQLLHARGIRRIVGITRSAAKRALALRIGASDVCAPDEAAGLVAELTAGEGAPLVIEAVGQVPTLAQAIRLSAPGATIVAFGTITGTESRELPFYELYRKELRILNPRAALPRDYDRAIALVAGGEVDPSALWTRSYPFAEAAAAIADADAGHGTLKVTLHP